MPLVDMPVASKQIGQQFDSASGCSFSLIITFGLHVVCFSISQFSIQSKTHRINPSTTLHSYLPSAPKSHVDLSFLKDLSECDQTKLYYVSGVLAKELEPFRTNIQHKMRYGIPVISL